MYLKLIKSVGLSTFKGAEMCFFKAIIFGVLFLSSIQGEGKFHIHQTYDLNENGRKETLLLNANGISAIWVEILSEGNLDTLWSYSSLDGAIFTDGELVDINNDTYKDLILIPDLYAAIGNQAWCYIFLGDKNGFSEYAITIKESLLELSTIRPSNLSIVPGESVMLAVSFGSPIRKGMVFDIEVVNREVQIKESALLSAPIISNGYGSVYIGGFINDKSNYIALLSTEGSNLKTAIFDGKRPYDLLLSESITVDNARYLMGSDLQQYKNNDHQSNGLLVPFGTDDIFQLRIVDGNALLSKTSLSGKSAFPLNESDNIESILNDRKNVEIVHEKQHKRSNFKSKPYEEVVLSPSSEIVPDESVTLNTKTFIEEIENARPDIKNKNLEQEKHKKDYSSLAPTLTDFLNSVKNNSSIESDKEPTTSIPTMNHDMKSTSWADEAGFTQLELGEFVPELLDTTKASPIPKIDQGITLFREDVIDSLQSFNDKNNDKDKYLDGNRGIDLYYVLVMTSISEKKDRYVFDGEAPFGVAINQIPSMGKATHLQHGISADLSSLKIGEVYDFAYSLRDARLDSITTLTMVHDMQTNIVFMSISPTDDSLSQSYTSDSFDPKLFEFPDYFFEGFPNSLDMDFKDKLIRFSFDEDKDSTYKGIYLSVTTPSFPSQSLAVFMDQGKLQSIRGEVVVRANGSKKVSTEFDLIGNVKPAVMFSRLIQEMFPEDLKLKLLQGASLEEPLFGPSGKLPKISREPRLPEVQSDQVETSIPIEPKQSNVPETEDDSISTKYNDVIINPATQVDEVEPQVLEVEKRAPDNSAKKDSLNLESVKEEKISKKEIKPSAPEESQPEQEPIKIDTTSDKD